MTTHTHSFSIIALLFFSIWVLLPSDSFGEEANNVQLTIFTKEVHPSFQKGEALFHDMKYALLIFLDPNKENVFFNNRAEKYFPGSRVESCSLLIDVPVGTSRGNHSYGGLCVINNAEDRQNSLVCGDVMLGRFKEKPIGTQKVTTEQLVEFVITNCYGG